MAIWIHVVCRWAEVEIPDDLPPDVWMMCDQAEAHIARERDGIIVSEEGVWDAEMNQLLAFGET